jgi:4'-phosphopantetheinyl transferase
MAADLSPGVPAAGDSSPIQAQPAEVLWLHPLHDDPAPERVALLSAEEIARAQRFVFERHRRRFLAAHCALRERLSQHTGLAPQALDMAEGPFGKPFLANAPGCHFNLSHSDDWALIGIRHAGPIGVDIELRRSVRDAEALARANFTAEEFDAFMAVPHAARDEVFLRVWTRKEALLKALGTGLSMAPASVHVGIEKEASIVKVALPAGTVTVEVRSHDANAETMSAVASLLPK